MKNLAYFLWYVVIIGACFGVIVIVASFAMEMNAIQQTSAFALALSLVILPYCVARAFDEIHKK
jgi:uncharacterized membrane protein